ncbi:CAP domain-containing protein [Siminovitchia fortis]|uniref:Sporulation protein n=1 Tax=Siminovitchia fortis TaxID=254758 RepID=A0A443IJ61_9BACI|nr:CAP domain-containing protein [Siminovitchia fortis]RWR04241.1 sporulation protein [Siminovitchia fortis]WHY83045.1 CAP domain-containing protein [Siminovitchia fortis]
MKKSIVSTAAALAILAAPIAGQASAATPDQAQSNVKVYYYQTDGMQKMNNWCDQFVYKYYPNWKTEKDNYQPEKQAQKPAEQQPAQKPAEKPQQPKKEEQKPAEQQNSQLSAYEQKVVELTNAERAKNGLAPLKVDVELSKVAREKSRDMSANNYFDHNSPTYGSPFDMMKKFGISYRSAGENIAQGQRTPEEVVNAWMNSSGHRENILSKDYTHIGVGHAADGNYWTQQFIGK